MVPLLQGQPLHITQAHSSPSVHGTREGRGAGTHLALSDLCAAVKPPGDLGKSLQSETVKGIKHLTHR